MSRTNSSNGNDATSYEPTFFEVGILPDRCAIITLPRILTALACSLCQLEKEKLISEVSESLGKLIASESPSPLLPVCSPS